MRLLAPLRRWEPHRNANHRRHGVLGRAAALWRPLPGRAVPDQGAGGVPVNLNEGCRGGGLQAESWRTVGGVPLTSAEWLGWNFLIGLEFLFCINVILKSCAQPTAFVDGAFGIQFRGEFCAADQMRVAALRE